MSQTSEAAALGVVEVLTQLGLAGATAGAQVASGADNAAASLDDLSGAADNAAAAAEQLGASADSAGDSLAGAAADSQSLTIGLGGVSAAFLDAAASAHGLDRITFGLLQDQTVAVDELTAKLREQIDAASEGAGRLSSLRNEFNLIGDDRLREIAQLQNQLDELQRRRREQEERNQGGSSTNGGGGSRPGTGGGVVFSPTINLSGAFIGRDIPPQMAQELARRLRPELERLGRL